MQFGGNTSCTRVDHQGCTLLIDGGTGLMQYLEEIAPLLHSQQPLEIDIIISHLHLDHIIGLATFTPLWQAHHDICIYTRNRGEAPLARQIFGVFAPPYWPVNLEQMLCAQVIAITDQPFTTRGGITVQPFPSLHQDGTTGFHMSCDGQSLVYMLDCEINTQWSKYPALLDFCQGADAIIFDSSFLPEDYAGKEGWGHSTYEHGLALAQQSHCKRMIFSHFYPSYSDADLARAEDILQKAGDQYRIAYDGMEFSL